MCVSVCGGCERWCDVCEGERWCGVVCVCV